MTDLRVVPGGAGGAPEPVPGGRDAIPESLRPLVPLDVPVVEVVEHRTVDVRALGLFGAVLAAVLGFVSLLAPEIWREPAARLAGPLAAYLSPWVLLAVREALGRGVVVVTADGLGVHTTGRPPVYLRYRAVRRVRRARWLGGVRLETARGRVWLPPRLAEGAREAIVRARGSGGRLATLAGEIDDPLGFLEPPSRGGPG